ncbi:hypothetical protein Nmel_000187 [Mimus melanotis]
MYPDKILAGCSHKLKQLPTHFLFFLLLAHQLSR